MAFQQFQMPSPSMRGGPQMRAGPAWPSSPYSAGRGFASKAWGAAVKGGGVGTRNAGNRMTPNLVSSPWGQRQQATGVIAGQQPAGPRGAGQSQGRAQGRGVSKDTKMKAVEDRRIMKTNGNPWLDMATTGGAGQMMGAIGDWRTINNRTLSQNNGLVGGMLDRGIRAAGHGAIEGTREEWQASNAETPDLGFDPFEPQKSPFDADQLPF